MSVGLLNDGFQANGIGREEVAIVKRLAAVNEGNYRGAVCRWGEQTNAA
jgi:hypothetical protein